MDLQLKGRGVVVTGATRGIGRAIADLFAAEGANVAICARKPDEVEAAVAALRARKVEAYGEAFDIADGEALTGFVRRSGEVFGRLDAVVSNASALSIDASEAAWRALLDIDVLGAVRTFEAARPFLEASAEAHGDAAFVIISSVSAAETANISPYGAMKAALIHLAKGIAREMAPKKVRANVVSPGTVFFEDGVWGQVSRQAPQYFETVIKRNPTGRMATPEEIAHAAVFLSSAVSSFTTGSNLLVDGAISARVNF